VRLGGRIDGLGIAPPFGLLAYSRVNFSVEGNAYREVGTDLRMFAVSASGDRTEIESGVKGTLVRALLDAQVRRDPDASSPAIAALLKAADAQLEVVLRRPTDPTMRHVVFPVAAVIVTSA
jgi:hypothetical protein